MKKLLVTIALLNFIPAGLYAGDNGSFEQLLQQLSTGLAPVETPEPSLGAAAQAPDGRRWVTLRAADKYARTRLLEAGLDIVEIKGDKVSGFASPALAAELTATKSAGMERSLSMAEYSALTKDFPSNDAAYHNYKETTDLLNDLASKNSDIASVFSLGKTVEGRDIWCLRINSSAKGTAASNKPGAFFLGNHHAREHLSNEVPLLFAAWLMDHRNDADVKGYINSLDIYIAPMLNADGSEYDIKTGKYQYFRKNTRVNSDKTIGVDLNRNYDSWFCKSGGSTYPGSDTYCGPKAFSEPETQAVKKFFESHRNVKTHISYHTYGGTVLYPWGGQDADVSNEKDKKAFVAIAAKMAGLTGYDAQKSSELYIATGDSCDWAYAATGALAFTIELEGNGFYPGAAAITRAVNNNVKAAVYLLSVTADPYKAI